MKHARKFTCLAALAMSAVGTTAHADLDDNYPWQSPGGTFSDVSMMSRAYSGNFGTSGGLAISSATDVDYHVIACGNRVHPVTGVVSPGIISSMTVEFTHASGDLDIVVYGVEGNLLGVSNGVIDNETVGMGSANRSVAVVKIYGYSGATNSYGLSLVCK